MKSKMIMVVEDELIVAEDLTHWLTGLGYGIGARAANGQEAVQRCEATRPDLVLMDILLPGDMDGIQAAEVIRNRFDIPVVYITASSDEATLARAKVTQPFGYILKPFDERSLYSTIEMALYKHESEKRLRESEERFRLLFEHAPVAFHALDADGHVVQVNRAWQELFGYTQEEIAGRWLGEVLGPGSVDRFIANFTQFKRTPVTDSVSVDMVCKDGTLMTATFKGSIAVDERGRFAMTQCVLETTPRRGTVSAGEAESGEGAAAPGPPDVPVLDLGNDAVLVLTPDGMITGANRAAEALLGWHAEQLRSMNLRELTVATVDAGEVIARVLSADIVDRRVASVRTKQGESLEVVMTGVALHGRAAKVEGACLILQRR
jgi:PAS domain S-box-containing protein